MNRSAAVSSPPAVQIQLCKKSVERLPGALPSVLSALRDREHSPVVKDCLNRCEGCERGGLIAKRFSAPSVAESETPTVPLRRTEDEVERYMQAQQLMSDAINAHLGFRGYGLMMRLQKTANIRDLHDLLPEFAKALVKRLGIEPATPIVSSIERLITGA